MTLPMRPYAKHPATYADVEAAPDGMVAELLDRALYLHPRPAAPHGRVVFRLGAALADPFDPPDDDPDGWWFAAEPELRLGEHVVVPDLAGWRRARMPVYPRDPAFTMAPDWICEVLSPSTAAIDRGRKRSLYAEQGVGHLWLIDPEARTLEVFKLDAGRWILAAVDTGEASIAAPPFEAAAIDLARLWTP